MSLFDKFISSRKGKPQAEAQPTVESLRLVAQFQQAVRKNKSMLLELKQQTESLTKKDIGDWRQAWQMAINKENPKRGPLLRVYTDAMVDLHLTGCIAQRKGKTLEKAYIFTNQGNKENDQARAIFERQWFIDFMDYALDRSIYGHSLIQLGNIVTDGAGLYFSDVQLVPREHVIPEYGVITKEPGDDWRKGISYREGPLSQWCVEVGKKDDLGLLLKCAPQSLSKKNMLAFWDTFGEIFGMPIRVAKTTSTDSKDLAKIESMLASMGAAAYALFPEGTEIDIKEASKGDAFNVYDKRVDRCNSEISKGILNQTMTIDSGSSLSQSETHLEVFENVCRADATFLKYIINGSLIPKMIRLGFPLEGVSFDWDEAVSYTPAEQREMERMLIQYYDIDPKYFTDKYKIPITGKREATASGFFQ